MLKVGPAVEMICLGFTSRLKPGFTPESIFHSSCDRSEGSKAKLKIDDLRHEDFPDS